jgi:hypothetical protein
MRRGAEAIEQDRTVLACLREPHYQLHWVNDTDTLGLMHEAEALIATPRATTER